MADKGKKHMDEAKQIADSVIRQELKNEIVIRENAVALKNLYDTYIHVGFSEEQAFDLLCITLEANLNNMKN